MEKTILDIEEIQKEIPHRYPFLLVDKIIEMDVENDIIVGQKNVTYNEPFFQGHFPGSPIMPGVLILEALAQTGGVLVHKKGEKGKISILMSVSNAKFRHPVKPGDILTLRAEGKHLSRKGGKVKATAYVGDKMAVQAEIGFAIVDQSQI